MSAWSEPKEEPFGRGKQLISQWLEPTALLEWGSGKICIYKTVVKRRHIVGGVTKWDRYYAEDSYSRNSVASEPFKVHQRCMWCPENDIPKAISELRKYFFGRIEKNETEYIRTKQRMNDLLSELDILQDKMEGE